MKAPKHIFIIGFSIGIRSTIIRIMCIGIAITTLIIHNIEDVMITCLIVSCRVCKGRAIIKYRRLERNTIWNPDDSSHILRIPVIHVKVVLSMAEMLNCDKYAKTKVKKSAIAKAAIAK